MTGSTVVFVGGTITGSHTLDSVEIRGGTVTIAAGTTLTTTGYLNLFSGTLNQAAATGTLAAQANVDVQSGFTTGGTATLLMNGGRQPDPDQLPHRPGRRPARWSPSTSRPAT